MTGSPVPARGTDGVLGDDGRIYTSRHIALATNVDRGTPASYAEPRYGVYKVDET